MAIILPAIHLLLLFSNFWFTFKQLKIPRNRNGETTLRLAQQRKRELRNCLVVWLVWSLGCTLEKMADYSIGFLPFYYECKAFLWLILLCTRSIAAEPIFLRLIRPTIKPYTTVIDSTLDLLHLLSELLLVLSIYPCKTLHGWWTFKGSMQTETTPIESTGLLHSSTSRGPVTRSQLREASSQANVILSEVKDAQRRVQASRSSSVRHLSTRGRGAGTHQVPTASNVAGSSTTIYQTVDPKTLNFDDEPDVTAPKSRRRNTQNKDAPSTVTAMSTTTVSIPVVPAPPVRSTSDMTNETSGTVLLPTSSYQTPVRSVSQPTCIDMDISISQPDPSWSGVYPPLPAAYPATPAPLRPLSLLTSQPPPHSEASRQTHMSAEPDPYPPFPAAYPLTPPPPIPASIPTPQLPNYEDSVMMPPAKEPLKKDADFPGGPGHGQKGSLVSVAALNRPGPSSNVGRIPFGIDQNIETVSQSNTSRTRSSRTRTRVASTSSARPSSSDNTSNVKQRRVVSSSSVAKSKAARAAAQVPGEGFSSQVPKKRTLNQKISSDTLQNKPATRESSLRKVSRPTREHFPDVIDLTQTDENENENENETETETEEGSAKKKRKIASETGALPSSPHPHSPSRDKNVNARRKRPVLMPKSDVVAGSGKNDQLDKTTSSKRKLKHAESAPEPPLVRRTRTASKLEALAHAAPLKPVDGR